MTPPGAASDSLLSSAYDGRGVCVTGGAGFIGSHLVRALIGLGANVRVIDDLSTGLRSNLDDVADRVELIEASMLDRAAMREAAADTNVIFHQAALTSVPRSVEQPERYIEVNAGGTLSVLETARAVGAKRIVYASSSSVYGEQSENPDAAKIETMIPDPRSPYAASKLAGEHLLKSFAYCYDLTTVSLRYFNIFGPGQRADSPYAAVIPKFAEAMRRGESPAIFGDGTQTRDYTYVDNAVRANLLAGAVDREMRGEAINVACGEATVLNDLVDAMKKLLNVDVSPTFAPERVGEVKHSRADIGKANSLLGYEPNVQFDEGLRLTLR